MIVEVLEQFLERASVGTNLPVRSATPSPALEVAARQWLSGLLIVCGSRAADDVRFTPHIIFELVLPVVYSPILAE